MLRCSLAQAEPRSQYIQLVYIIYCCATQIKQKFLYLHYFAAGQSGSQVGTLAAHFPISGPAVLSIRKLVEHGQVFHSIGPTLQFPKVWRRISLYFYAQCCSSHVSPHYNYSFSYNRPEEIPSAGKHMARPRCFLSESNPYDFTIVLLKNLCFIRTLPQSTISPSRYPNWTLPQKCSWDNFDWDWIALMSEPNITIQSLSNLSPTAHQIQFGKHLPNLLSHCQLKMVPSLSPYTGS